MPGGGHFAAYEQPDLLSRDLVAFFRTAQRLPVIMQTEDANSERIASMGGARSIVEGLPDLWGAAAEYSLKLQRDVIATSTAPRGLPAMHHLARLHAELTVGYPVPVELANELFDWSLGPSTYFAVRPANAVF